MRDLSVIIKEEIDIDDTNIKLELDENGDENEEVPELELSSVGRFMKIIEERPNMITVPVHDYNKSEDELKFIASLDTLDQQQKLFVTSTSSTIETEIASAPCTNACNVCSFTCKSHFALASHQVNHQLNRHSCSVQDCGIWCNTLEEILEHEYRKHGQGLNNFKCRICRWACQDPVNLTKHMTTHFYVRRFVCALCRRHFETREELKLHREHSQHVCGRVAYTNVHGNVGQLVAVSKLNADARPMPAELLCDVSIKTEPLDLDEQQTNQLHELSDVAVKTEPKDEPDSSPNNSSNDTSWLSLSSTSFSDQLRSKLRLPTIKKPLKSDPVDPNAVPSIQFVPAGKWKPIPMPNQILTKKRPNILKPKRVNNQATSTLNKNILEAPKNNPNVAANILKVLPSNCMVIKLPPNTKIIKIPPSTPNTNSNSCAIGNKIITLPSSISITQSADQKAGISTTPATVANSADTATSSLPSALLTTPVNRNAFFNALTLFESLPESRKIIAEFQSQIRSIEQSLPLPGSVLQTPRKNGVCKLPAKFEVLQLPPTKVSNAKVCELRFTYPSHRFHWECPKCARCYEQYSAYCNHLVVVHNIAMEELELMEVDVKAYRKTTEEDSVTNKINVATAAIVAELTAGTAVAPKREVPAAPAAVPAAPVVVAPAATKALTVKGPVIRVPALRGPAARAPLPPVKQSTTVQPSRLAQFQCDDCSKCFTTLGAMRIHKMIHTGELPHKCNYCEKRFRTPGQVRVHQRRHTGEKPFKCKICSLDFTHRETLISHLSRHIGMKRYKCYGCDKNFVVVSGLRAHRRLRPDTCGKVKFTARAHGPRVRVIRGEVIFESHPEHNGYLRSEDPLNILSEMSQFGKDKKAVIPETVS